MSIARLAVVAFAFVSAIVGCAPAAGAGIDRVLSPVAAIPLPGTSSRFDYQSIDPRQHLLFVAHLGDGTVDVIDLRKNDVRAVIPNISQVHGVLAVPELGRVYATATGTNELAVIDAHSLRVVARVEAGDYPDGIAYAVPERKLYISDETGGTVTAIDVRTNRRVATIALGGEAGNTQFDPRSNRIFVNAQTSDQLIEIDPRRDRIVGRTALSYCKNNHGLLVNAPARTAYIACDENATLLTYDMRTHKVTAKNSVGDEPDVLAYDARNKRLYVAAESGVVSVFAAAPAGTLSKIGMGLLAPNAHSVAVDPATGYSYFPIQRPSHRPVLKVFKAGTVQH
ncbi:MAG TPA: YncE family protein [Candidatus Baltobacteraceae bacterium]